MMATILRSSKYVRSIAELANKLGFSKFKGNVRVCISQTQGAPSTLARSLATQVAAQTDNDSRLEYSLQKLDADVKRFGRISKSKVDRIFNVFQQSKSVTSTQALMILRCCGSLIHDELPQSRSELVNEIWKSLENSGIQLDIAHYNTLLRVYSENDYEFSPVEILADLERKGIEPNKLTYQRLIARYCEKGDVGGAGKILEFMKEKGISVNENIFTALVRGHVVANDMSSAADILLVMKQAGLKPSADTYKELLCGHAKHGDMESITRTLSECRSNNLQLLDADYLEIISSFASNGHTEHIETILSMMPRDIGYHQESLNHIVKLVQARHVGVAKQVLTSIPSRENGRSAPAMIKQLAKCDLSAETLCDMCKDIVAKGINSEALMIALGVTLMKGNAEASLALINAVHESGKEIREHYFWPILLALGRSANDSAVNDVLRTMQSTYNLSISTETLQDYVLVHKTGEPEAILADLSFSGLPPWKLFTPIYLNLINQSKLKEAAEFIQKHEFHHNVQLFSRPLATALAQSRDAKSYVAILHHIYQNRFDVRAEDDWLIPTNNNILQPFLLDAINLIKHDKIAILSEVFEELPKAGLTINDAVCTALERAIGNEMTPSLRRLLNRLKYRHLTYITASETNFRADILKLEESLNKLTSNEKVIATKKRLLFLYSSIQDLSNLERLEKDLKKQEVPFNELMYKQLLYGYLNSNSLDKVEECLRSVQLTNPNFKMDTVKLAKYITLLIENDRTEDAVKFLLEQINIPKGSQSRNTYWRVLNNLADLGNPEVFDTVFNTFLQNEYITISNVYLGLLVKVHIARGDLQTALNVFEKLCGKYKLTPYKNELAKKFIETEDATSLQRLVDFSTQVHGELNSLYDLAQSFIEMDCLRQAKKILEIPALRDKVHKLKLASKRFCEMEQTINLERLVSIIKDVPHLKGLPEFYNDLLHRYVKENNWENGMNLWKQMLDEDIEPSNEFLVTLANLLKENQQPIPYQVPKLSKNKSQNVDLSSNEQSPPKGTNKNNHAESETDLMSETVSRQSKDSEIEALVRDQKLNEACKVVENVLNEGLFPLHRVLRFLLKNLGKAGEIELIENLSKKITVTERRLLNVEYNRCWAYIKSGKIAAYLDILEKHYEADYSDGSDQFVAELPSSAIRIILDKHPEYLERYTKFAEDNAAKGILQPMNLLWIHYFTQGNPIADEIWSEHMKTYPELRYGRILRTAHFKNNPALIEALLEKLESSPVHNNPSDGYIYSRLIQLYCTMDKHEQSIDTLRRALTKVPVDKLKRSVLGELVEYLTSKGQSLPDDIVEKINGDVTPDKVRMTT